MKKRYRKEFEYKGQMINYYNKLRQNEKIRFCTCCLDMSARAYVVEWEYK